MKTIVFDIETIPDLDACTAAGVDPAAGYPAWPLNEIICISLFSVENVPGRALQFDLTTVSRAQTSERGIVATVEQAFSEAQQVMSYNGFGFDIPVLLGRAALTGEHVPSIAKAGRRSHAGSHVDVIDLVSSYGAAPRPKLIEACAALRIPAKTESAVGGVAELARRAEYERISAYCEGDAISTWLLAQMWQSTETRTIGSERWAALACWIIANQPRLAHLHPYCEVPLMPGGGRRMGSSAAVLINL